MPSGWGDAMTRGLASMYVEDARILVTNRFVETVADMTGNASYTTERGSGAVAARTVTNSDGSTIVVNYEAMSSRPLADVERLLAHEAGHVVIDARGTEDTAGYRDSNEVDWQWWLKCFGAQAIVEFRIERALIELGYPAAEGTSVPAVDNSLLITNVEVVGAVVDPASIADPAHLQDVVLTTLNHVTKLLAYIAAPISVGLPGFSPSQLSAEGQANWAEYIAPTWQRRLALWATIPSALESIPAESWRIILRKSVKVEQALLRDIGFAFRSFPDSRYGFYRVGSDGVFTQRLSRARDQIDAQTDLR